MEAYQTKTHTGFPRSRASLLLGVRDFQCSYFGSPNEKGSDPFGTGIGDGSGVVFDAFGRFAGMPRPHRAARSRNELPGSQPLDREIYWVIQRESDQSLSRVLTALWLRFLWWKTIRDHAQREMEHYDDTWTRLEEYNDAVKQKAEPRLLTK